MNKEDIKTVRNPNRVVDTVKAKESYHQEIDEQIAEFLAKGGKIQVFDQGEQKPHKPLNYRELKHKIIEG